MSGSSDSFLPDPPKRTEEQARIQAALAVARRTMKACEDINVETGAPAIAFAAVLAIGQIIQILEAGKKEPAP